MNPAHSNFDPAPALDLINSIQVDLDRLKGLIQPPPSELDPADPRNKAPDGKLTPRGVEVCYRLFDANWTRYAVAKAMDISFGAASYRLNAWRANLVKLALQPGPNDYLAYAKLARRLQIEPSTWNPQKGPWPWSPLDVTRPPHAAEMEWALLKCSLESNAGKDSELKQEQEARLNELDLHLEQDPNSFERKCYCAIKDETD